MSHASHFKLSQDVSLTEVDDESVLLDLKSGQYFGLNDVGTVLIQRLLAGESVEQAVGHIETEFNAPAEQIARDVTALISEMSSKQLLQAV